MRPISSNCAKLIEFLFFTALGFSTIRQTAASKCVVSKWQEWSECQGNCEFAQRVRNRDVLRPPFPERDERTGELFIRECPPLYEVEHCTPRDCADESPFVKLPSSLLKRLPSRPAAASSVGSSEERFIKQHESRHNADETRRAEPKKAKSDTKSPLARTKVAGIGIHSDSSGSGKEKESENGSTETTINKSECGHRNQSCCRQNRPSNCSNGTKSRLLIRWYRKKDEQFCRPYKYSFCDGLFDRTFASESECLDACFSEVEKAVLPNFRVI